MRFHKLHFNINLVRKCSLTLLYTGFCHDRTTQGGGVTRAYYIGYNTTNVAQNVVKYVQNNKKTFCNFWFLFILL